MILVEVNFYMFHRTYDFKLDETIPVRDVVAQMVQVIAQKERIPVGRDAGLFMLGSLKRQKIFCSCTTLAENGIRSGETLFLT
ncbi:MAG: EsaB/YukD family protein [Lachnospiraceae bacterium]|nr:EsaB/YukD family protein [Lachnospiraceae bacterium]